MRGGPASWFGRVRADLAASADDGWAEETGIKPGGTGHPAPGPGRGPDSVREFLLRVPHLPYLDWARRAGGRCACGEPRDAAIHQGRDLLMTAQWLISRGLGDWPPQATLSGPAAMARPRDVLDEIDEAVARISDADVEDSLRDTLRQAGYASEEEGAPATVPLRKTAPAPLPDGVLGYNVLTPRGEGAALAWLVSADLMPWDQAEHALGAVPGGVLVEIRKAAR